IEKMVKEAEAHAAEDKKRKEEIEIRNNGDSLVYQAEKAIKDLGDKADPALVGKVQAGVDKLKETLKGNDSAAIKADTDALMAVINEMASAAYQAAGAQEGQQAPGAGAQGAQQPKDDVVDADYTVVDDEKK
ncbi:MAG: Hsp70 family protein, partial [Selenomonadales bacterium]|nr:Hsp70 family protein [Selenomonadales bacterium]